MHDKIDGMTSDTKTSTKRGHAKLARPGTVELPDQLHISSGEACSLAVPFPFVVGIALLRVSITRVLRWCAEPKMRGITTGGIVTGMADTHPRWNGAMRNLPSYAMSKILFAVRKACAPIAKPFSVSLPFEATGGRAFHLRPEALLKNGVSDRIGVHRKLTLSDVMPLAVSSSAGVCYCPHYTTKHPSGLLITHVKTQFIGKPYTLDIVTVAQKHRTE